MHDNCLLVRQGIGWLGHLGDLNQSKYNILSQTSIKRVILADNSFFSIDFVRNIAFLMRTSDITDELKPTCLKIFVFNVFSGRFMKLNKSKNYKKSIACNFRRGIFFQFYFTFKYILVSIFSRFL